MNIQSFQVCQVHSELNISDLFRGGATRWDPSDPFIAQRRCKVPGKERPKIKPRKAWSTDHTSFRRTYMGLSGLMCQSPWRFVAGVLSHLRCASTYSRCVSLHKQAQFQLPFHLKSFPCYCPGQEGRAWAGCLCQMKDHMSSSTRFAQRLCTVRLHFICFPGGCALQRKLKGFRCGTKLRAIPIRLWR